MKLIFKFLLNLIIVLILFEPVYGDQMKNDFTVRRKTAEDGYLFSWLRSGLLFVRVSKEGKVDYLYCGSDGYLSVVSTLPKFSEMVREQLNDSQSAESFLKSWLPRVFFAFMGSSHADVIDRGYLNYRKGLPPYAWPEGVSTMDIERSFKLLEKYDYAGPTIKDGKWRTEFYVLLHDGSVEKWELDGKVQNFSVDHLTKTIVEKPRTIVTFLEFGTPP